MILIDVEVYNIRKKRYELFEAIFDTGSTFCAIAKHIAVKLGLTPTGTAHLWQVNGPVTPDKTSLKMKQD